MIHQHNLARPYTKLRTRSTARKGVRVRRANPTMVSTLNFVEVPPTKPEESLASAVSSGLSREQKTLPSRFFYDRAGSRLFEQITKLPEYYLTRSETEILRDHAAEIVAEVGGNLQMVEFGSGSSEKTRLLLKAAMDQGGLEYVPIDISTDFLRASAFELIEDLPGLNVSAVAGDYLDALTALPRHRGPRLFLFIGSTIGNFETEDAKAFLAAVRKVMRPKDRLLLGADLKKDPATLEAAYNDSQGITADFNKNLLVRINRDLCAHFDLRTFRHEAPWVEGRSRIEMRLVSLVDQTVEIEGLGRSFHFEKGEYIHTENSHKFSREAVDDLVGSAGLETVRRWTDARGWFALQLLQSVG